MTFLASLIPRGLLALLLGALLLAAPHQTATAQQLGDAPPSLIQHLRADLSSRDAQTRSDALVDVVSLATCSETCTVSLRSIDRKKITINDETGTGGVIELNDLTPQLIEAYRSGPADGHRLLALSALINIGNEAALERLIDDSAEQSKTLRRQTHRSIAAFYLEKYPELLDGTVKSQRLSLDDVLRAKTLRIRELDEDQTG